MSETERTKERDETRTEAADAKEKAKTTRTAKATKAAAAEGAKPAGKAVGARRGKTTTAEKVKPAGKAAAAGEAKSAKATTAASAGKTRTTVRKAAAPDIAARDMPQSKTNETRAAGARRTATRTMSIKKAGAVKASVEPDAERKPDMEAESTPQAVHTVDNAPQAAEASESALSSSGYDFGAAEEKLIFLQQKIREQKIPVVILLEGWSAAGKGLMAGELLEGLDPRGYQVCVNEHFTKAEDGYPYLRRYWVNMPRQGNVALFIGSWYQKICADMVKGRKSAEALLEKAKLMEEMLACDGVVTLKFFLDLSKKEQKRRLTELERKKRTSKRVNKADWEQNRAYSQWEKAYQRALRATDLPGREWHVLSGESKRDCKQGMYETVIAAFENALAQREKGDRTWDAPRLTGDEPLETAIIQHLQMFEPSQALDADYKSSLNAAQKELKKLQYEVYRAGIPVVIAFEGWDAAGKGGAIRRLTGALDPRNFTVSPICAPTAEEKEHHHLWRFWTKLPARGEVRVFDRTWYGRVMVERIEGFCTEPQWRRAYDEINRFEQDLLDEGAVICKFWLQIDNEEQLKRFNARQKTPDKQWKITDEDWRNREKWPQYETAVDEMLQKTNTQGAPWTVVEANNKQYARIKVLRTVIDAMKTALKKA